MAKGKSWDALSKVGEGAALTETKGSQSIDTPIETKAKHLKNIPMSYFNDYKKLKATGKSSLDFSAYIIEALREKLERDNEK